MFRALVFIISVACTGTVLAADIVNLPASKGKVSFPHKQHQDMLKDCMKCHEKGPGKIADMGQTWAHTVCKGCHTSMNKGPVVCSDCHSEVH